MPNNEVRDTRVPSLFDIEHLLSEVRSFEHEPSLARICNVQPLDPEEKGEESALRADPSSLRFEFAHNSVAPVTRSLRLHNLRAHKIKVYLAPPTTSHFTLPDDRVAYIYPGRPLNLHVTFTPTESRNFGADLRIDVPADVGLVIELSARPRCRHADFPDHIDFGLVPLGSSVERSLVILPCADHDVKFSVLRNKWDCDLLVGPLWGIIHPNDGPCHIRIVFAPSAYVTALYELKVFVPTASLTPFRVAIVGCCVPSFARNQLLSSFPAVKDRPKKLCKQRSGHGKKSPARIETKPTTPVVKTCHPDAHIQLGPFGRSMEEEWASYMALCDEFVLAAAALRKQAWSLRIRDEVIHLGDADHGKGFKQQSSKELKDQSIEILVSDSDSQFVSRETPRFFNQRTIRRSTQNEEKALTGWYSKANADFFVRYQILCKFIAAARRAVTTNRLKARLQLLKDHAAETIAAEEAAEKIAAQDVADKIKAELQTDLPEVQISDNTAPIRMVTP